MFSSDEFTRWTWNPAEHPGVSALFSSSPISREWCDELETAPSDVVTGKVLCVIAGIAIARSVIAKNFSDHERLQESIALIDLANDWVDDPTDEKFDQITRFLFEDDREWAELGDPLKIAWGALRVATSSVGNFEAGWALGIVADNAAAAGVDAMAIGQKAVESRASSR